MKTRWQWSVPANVLLMGEYAVTQPGGLGVGLAVSPRADGTLEIDNAHTGPESCRRVRRAVAACARSVRAGTPLEGLPFEVIGRFGGSSGAGETGAPLDGAHPLVRAAVGAVGDAITTEEGEDPAPDTAWDSVAAAVPASITIDTRAFFDHSGGTKRGLGSSAAAVVLFTAALLQLTGRRPEEDLNGLLGIAIRAHRAAHAGRGSGYDVATSTLGGVIRFCGGAKPAVTGTDLAERWERHGVAVYGMQDGPPVRSAEAVARFEEYIPPGSPERAEFFEENNRLVRRMEDADTWPAASRTVLGARRLGERIGEAIGVPATLSIGASHQDDGWVAKACGAGNERAIILAGPHRRRRIPSSAERLAIERAGFREESAGRPGAAERPAV